MRELLLQHQDAARAAVARWLDETEAELSRWHQWHARQGEYMRELVLAQAERGEATDSGPCPGEGFVYMRYWRGAVCLHRVDAWVPREISDDTAPATDRTMPLPVPDERDVSPDARWAALVAVHDMCRVPEERIGPVGRLPYEWLIGLAAVQPAEVIPTLREWLTSITTPAPNHRPDQPPPPPDLGVPPPSGAGGTGPARVNRIRKMRLVWEIQYGDEKEAFPLRDFTAVSHIVEAIRSPGLAVQVCAAPEARDDVMDDEALREIDDARNELQRKIAANAQDRQKHKDDHLVLRELDEERDKFEEQLRELDTFRKEATRPGGKRRKLGITEADTEWAAIRVGVSRLWPRLREAGMPKLADHLQNAIDLKQSTVKYNPPAGTLPWSVET